MEPSVGCIRVVVDVDVFVRIAVGLCVWGEEGGALSIRRRCLKEAALEGEGWDGGEWGVITD